MSYGTQSIGTQLTWVPNVGNYASQGFYYELRSLSSSVAHWNLIRPSDGATWNNYGLHINTSNELEVNDAVQGTGGPYTYSVTRNSTTTNHGASGQTNKVLVAGDYVELFELGNSMGAINITTAHLWPVGPTVSSITAGYIITNDTVSNTDFTLLKNGSAYANTNISLTAATIILPSNAHLAGYNYNITYSGTAVYSRTIDSLSHHAFYWDDSWTSSPTSARSTNSNRILNVLATIPSNITIGSGSDLNGNPNPLTTVFNNVSRVITHTLTATIDGVSNEIHINFALDNKTINGQLEIIGTFYESRAVDGYTNVSQDYIIGNQQTMTYNQSLLGDTITYYVSDWVYSAEPEGDGYGAPVSTTSNGGGKPDRYPLIMTNLFNRNRSLYSIGMTHKDTWDLFL